MSEKQSIRWRNPELIFDHRIISRALDASEDRTEHSVEMLPKKFTIRMGSLRHPG
jgi:hypothetical protein